MKREPYRWKHFFVFFSRCPKGSLSKWWLSILILVGGDGLNENRPGYLDSTVSTSAMAKWSWERWIGSEASDLNFDPIQDKSLLDPSSKSSRPVSFEKSSRSMLSISLWTQSWSWALVPETGCPCWRNTSFRAATWGDAVACHQALISRTESGKQPMQVNKRR